MSILPTFLYKTQYLKNYTRINISRYMAVLIRFEFDLVIFLVIG